MAHGKMPYINLSTLLIKFSTFNSISLSSSSDRAVQHIAYQFIDQSIVEDRLNYMQIPSFFVTNIKDFRLIKCLKFNLNREKKRERIHVSHKASTKMKQM